MKPVNEHLVAVAANAQPYTDDLDLLLAILPAALQERSRSLPRESLLEIVLDLGRRPQARFPGHVVELSEDPVSREHLAHAVASVGEFSGDNRAGIEGTLHRISALRNRSGQIVGLTLRVGRAVFGTIEPVRDLVERGASILLLGKPGVGKTTKLREIARALADQFSKRVIVIDTSNEIAGDGDVPHPAIGSARRMQVPHPERQHAVMIEAVENHMPEVIIVDEIGTAAEALAARTIAERGVQLIGTAHGNSLENLVVNPTLCDLVGGVQTVTLGDEEARFRGTQKTITERKASPTFDAVVEIVDWEQVVVHADTARAVDNLLRGVHPGGVRRSRGTETVVALRESPEPETPAEVTPDGQRGPVRICAYAISRDLVERVLRDLRLEARTVRQPEEADLIIALRSRADDLRLRRVLSDRNIPVQVVKRNTTAQIRRLLIAVFNRLEGVEDHERNDAVREMEAAVQRAKREGIAVGVAPRCGSLRKLQHRIATRHRVIAESVGSEPQRHLVIYPS
ncbi:MAG: AAA family ATPase [Gammaproteobacteria bacterium]|nr:AAA family ATPase [Gammaproteobacteria bacterium]NIR82408.1 AAA family ATPase [Gammaproteobacteria bacterium]NIR91989.1 AAA family ATPase [Gammaproteobacteria bacterium]NIU03545.1 AAA family ATPase [Gammaproteobacteria bacterium]NIX84819.1 AAA family ATPase [Gammaproteobacteria bacterium]